MREVAGQTTVPAERGRLRPEFPIVLILAAAALVIYAQTLNHGFISFDDPGYVYENPQVTGGLTWANIGWACTSFERANWHPLTWLSLMADAQLYGLHASGYHLTNLLLHLANGLLLFFWLRRATGALWPAAGTAFFFLAHPMHVESVAWITERKDVLSTFFLLLTLIWYTRYVRGGGRRAYLTALLLYICGLLAKPMLVTLPALLVLLDFWPLARWENWRAWRRLVVDKLPFALLAAVSCVLTIVAQHRGSAVVPLGTLPLGYRLGFSSLGYGTYLLKTFYPVHLAIYYPFWRGVSPLWSFASALAVAAIVTGAFLRRRRQPWLLVGSLWFFGTLVPVIGLVQVGGQAVADRYMYVPHIGLFMALLWTVAGAGRAWQVPLAGLAVAAAAACLALSVRQAGYWRTNLGLFEHALQIVPASGRLNHLYGDALLEAKRVREAEAAYRAALRMSPGDDEAGVQIGLIAMQEERWEEAAAMFTRLAQGPDAGARMCNEAALALVHLGRVDEARKWYARALEKDAHYALAHFGLADLASGEGRFDEANAEYQKGLALRPDWVPALTRLAWNYAHSADGPHHQAALGLAQHAVDLTQGRDIACLNALAAAAAAAGEWDRAVSAATAVAGLAAQPNVPAEAAEVARSRVEAYRRHELPER